MVLRVSAMPLSEINPGEVEDLENLWNYINWLELRGQLLMEKS